MICDLAKRLNKAVPSGVGSKQVSFLTIVFSSNTLKVFLIQIRGVDTLQKVRGAKECSSCVYNAWEHFCDHAHIGDKGSPPLDDKLFFSVVHQK